MQMKITKSPLQFIFFNLQVVKPLHGFIHGANAVRRTIMNTGNPQEVFGSKLHNDSMKESSRCLNSQNSLQEMLDHAKPKQKSHTVTVCLVPHARHDHIWKAVTKARTELRDPGLFRWPPHANILYPFFDVTDKSEAVNEKLSLLREAVKRCEPFRISLDSFGSFGGQHRGVLFLYPRSFNLENFSSHQNAKNENGDLSQEPLILLQSILQEYIPECDDQTKNGKYTPHITLSHFRTLQEALDGQKELESWWSPLEFDVEEIYVLKRVGDDGQFKRLATLPLGSENKRDVEVHNPPLMFPAMPSVEEDWVREERMLLKARRNGNSRRGRRKRSRRKRFPTTPKPRDTPEVIARKRAERALKRERLALESAAVDDVEIQVDQLPK